MLTNRLKDYAKIEEVRNSKIIIYCTSDRKNAETNIAPDILGLFVNHLDKIGDVDKITLFLYSRGGVTLAGWSLVNLIRGFCKDFEVIIPFHCHSTATLIALGANRIIMTKQATLGPIDPSTNGLMNPQTNINNQLVRVPVSVEHVSGYLEMAKNELKITDSAHLKDIYLKLTDLIHPLSLGNVYRSKSQIQMLARKLLKFHEIEEENIEKVINFLCSESGSHDYTIHRTEAKESLGLNIEIPNEDLYRLIKNVYEDIETELELRNAFEPNIILSVSNPYNYKLKRALIESIVGESDVFISEGTLSKQALPNGQSTITDNRTFEGWKHETIPV
jgi:hypothetical protein